MIFYTYIYRDPSRNNECIYVGKGKEKRAWDHFRSKRKSPLIQRLQYMKKNDIEPSIEIVNALDESHAFLLEECLIEIIGRKDLGKGPLLNLTNGGEGTSGRVFTDEQKIASSISKLGEKNPLFGIKRSEEVKSKIGKSQPKTRIYSKKGKEKQTTRQLGEKNVMYGKLPANTIPIIYNGKEYKSIKEAALDNNVPYVTFWTRLKRMK